VGFDLLADHRVLSDADSRRVVRDSH